MQKVSAIARRHNLRIIEDACEALGATWQGRKVGTFGAAGTFAFYPNKQMTTGEGGMIVTNHKTIADLCLSLRNQGRNIGGRWLEHERLGYNYRLSDINCALGASQLSRIETLLKKRQQVADMYRRHLGDCRDIILPENAAGKDRVSWFVYVVRLALAGEQERNRVMRELKKKGVQTNDYFRPIHLQPFYRRLFGYRQGDFPVTERVASQTIALPFFNRLREKEIKYVCHNLKAMVARGQA